MGSYRVFSLSATLRAGSLLRSVQLAALAQQLKSRSKKPNWKMKIVVDKAI